jgi:two-component system OmpR family sensor kinase
VNGCLGRIAAIIRRKQLRIAIELNGRGSLRGRPEAVEIMVRNLIENAVHYTPDAGEVSIRTGPAADGAAAMLIENGPVDLTPADLPRLFEPFWRRDGGRSSREHAGLGLAVVQQVAQATGLRADAELLGDRLRIRVEPARSPSAPAAQPPSA